MLRAGIRSLKPSNASSLTSNRVRFSSTLLLIEEQGGSASSSNLHALSAAAKLGFPVTALVGASTANAEKIAKTVAAYPGVEKVLVASNDAYAKNLAEPHAELISQVAKNGGFSHVITAHSQYGKNVLPRAAALLDVSPISDVIEIDSPDTFKRPIYAGNLSCYIMAMALNVPFDSSLSLFSL